MGLIVECVDVGLERWTISSTSTKKCFKAKIRTFSITVYIIGPKDEVAIIVRIVSGAHKEREKGKRENLEREQREREQREMERVEAEKQREAKRLERERLEREKIEKEKRDEEFRQEQARRREVAENEMDERTQAMLQKTQKFLSERPRDNAFHVKEENELKKLLVIANASDFKPVGICNRMNLSEIVSHTPNAKSVDKIREYLENNIIDWKLLEQIQVFVIELMAKGLSRTCDNETALKYANDIHVIVATLSEIASMEDQNYRFTKLLFDLYDKNWELLKSEDQPSAKLVKLAEVWPEEKISIEYKLVIHFLEFFVQSLNVLNEFSLTETRLECVRIMIKVTLNSINSWEKTFRSAIKRILLDFISTRLWSWENVLEFVEIATRTGSDRQALLELLHRMNIYRISDTWRDSDGKLIIEILEKETRENIILSLEESQLQDKGGNLEVLLKEISHQKQIEKEILDTVKNIVSGVQTFLAERTSGTSTAVQTGNAERTSDITTVGKIVRDVLNELGGISAEEQTNKDPCGENKYTEIELCRQSLLSD